MAGAVQHVEGEVPDRDRVALVEPAVRRDRTRLEPIGLSLLREPLQEKIVGLVGALDRDAELLAQFGCATRVIDMAMREDDLLDAHAALRDGLPDAVEIAAGVDHGGL